MGITDIISLLGGLAFFLFGMSLLGEGLKRVAGGKLETVLGRLTDTTLKGLLLGMSIGASVPVLLSAIGANVNGRRAAFIYLYFNVIGTAALCIPFYLWNGLVGFPFMEQSATSLGIAVVNTVYKLLAALVLLPFAGALERFVTATVPDRGGEEDEEPEGDLLDERFLRYPPLAVEQSGQTLERMAAAACKNLERSIDLLHVFSREKYGKLMSREDRVDRYEDRLGNYLVRLSGTELSEDETLRCAMYLHCLPNLERVSDHAVNLAELAREMVEKDLAFSEQAARELAVCTDAVREIVSVTLDALRWDDPAAARRVEPLEQIIDTLTAELKVRHIGRLQRGECTLELGFIFNDCINNFERVSDHCSNIAVAVLESADAALRAHDYLRGVKRDGEGEYRLWMDRYEEKYNRRLMEIGL